MTKERKNELILLFNQGFTYEKIAEHFGTTRAYIENQFREIRKLENTYNLEHLEDKYRTNKLFKREIKPRTILDPFCGTKKFWETTYWGLTVISGDSGRHAKPDIKCSAQDLLTVFYKLNKKFDLIDIDPYGSPSEYLEKAIYLAKKGLIVTFGDTPNSMHRWGSRNDNHFKDLYGIDKKPIDVTGQDLADAVIRMAEKQWKCLEVSYLKVWNNCIRIYFKVK